jgi:uncharacterized phage protein (TIGR01671 family)
MKELKFRAYKKATKFSKAEMFDVGVLELDYLKAHDYYNFWCNYAGTTAHFDKDGQDIIMQFTGMKDKNGRDIYEGDILVNGLSGTWIVQPLENGSFSLIGICKQYKDANYSIDALNSNKEVIGNIYENPELLK